MKQVLINLAVSDLQKSLGFYSALGFTKQFSDETTMRLVWSDSIAVMLMAREKFATFATKPLADTKESMAGYFTLYVSGVEELNDIMTNGLAAGGTEPNKMSDYGFMQQRTIEDFDGHTWNLLFIDLTKMPQQP
jgi:uncharacterized protein